MCNAPGEKNKTKQNKKQNKKTPCVFFLVTAALQFIFECAHLEA